MTSLTSIEDGIDRGSMNRQWQLQEAKARLSELVRSVASEGPQEIRLLSIFRGEEVTKGTESA